MSIAGLINGGNSTPFNTVIGSEQLHGIKCSKLGADRLAGLIHVTCGHLQQWVNKLFGWIIVAFAALAPFIPLNV